MVTLNGAPHRPMVISEDMIRAVLADPPPSDWAVVELVETYGQLGRLLIAALQSNDRWAVWLRNAQCRADQAERVERAGGAAS